MSDRFGANWWRDSLMARMARHKWLACSGAALTTSGCYEYAVPASDLVAYRDRAADVDVTMNALSLQQNEGWNVGGTAQPLIFPGSSVTDIAGGERWRQEMESLTTLLAPAQPALWPYYVPTLFQSLLGPAGQGLRAVMRPILFPEMDRDFGRGVSLRSLYQQAKWPRDTAIVIDVPGPRAVAIAAALSDHFEPVFTFANWPHPFGVVPAHQTLAATLYYLPIFEYEKNRRPPGAPPMFVLDSNRLSDYTDEASQFDNRYLAQLPTAQALAALGIHHLMYVTDSEREQDDLNRAFVDLEQSGIDVNLVDLEEFQTGDSLAKIPELEESEDDPWFDGFLNTSVSFYFGGSPFWHATFWNHYCRINPKASGERWAGAHAYRYQPAFRANRFGNSHDVVGQVAARVARGTGAVQSVRVGSGGSFASVHAGRSGSIGRAGSFGGG